MSEILVKKEKFYYNVKLNRPDKHNALNVTMIQQLTEFFTQAAKDKFAGAIILTGTGSSFCSGGDLEWMKSSVDLNLQENSTDAEMLFDMFDAGQKCPLPIIGYMQGNVFGGGLGLTAICDIAISEASTRFCFSEVKLGLVPAVISSFVMDKMQQNQARRLMITAELFDAQKAYESGLVEYVGRELEAKEFLKSTLKHISHNGPEAVRALKQLLLHNKSATREKIKSESVKVIAERRVSQEGQEGMKSFFEKRKPAWQWANPEDADE
jgi:methylglutaconyl-CoA hydratase